jgi:hypothetical protein
VCPFHGKHAIVDIHETDQIDITACCQEFHELLENIISGNLEKPIETTGI